MSLSLTPMLKSMIDGIEKRGGVCDTVVCGSDIVAGEVQASLAELKRDFHVIADDEINPRNLYVTSQKALSDFAGGCKN